MQSALRPARFQLRVSWRQRPRSLTCPPEPHSGSPRATAPDHNSFRAAAARAFSAIRGPPHRPVPPTSSAFQASLAASCRQVRRGPGRPPAFSGSAPSAARRRASRPAAAPAAVPPARARPATPLTAITRRCAPTTGKGPGGKPVVLITEKLGDPGEHLAQQQAGGGSRERQRSAQIAAARDRRRMAAAPAACS